MNWKTAPLPDSRDVVLPPGCPWWAEQSDDGFWKDSDQLRGQIDKAWRERAERNGVALSRLPESGCIGFALTLPRPKRGARTNHDPGVT